MESIEEVRRWEIQIKLMIVAIMILGVVILALLFRLVGLNCEQTATAVAYYYK